MNKFSFVTIIINNDVNEHSKHLESTNELPFFFFQKNKQKYLCAFLDQKTHLCVTNK